MRAQTKIAVGVGVVLIVLGIVYVRSSEKKPAGQIADNTLPADDLAKSTEAPTAPLPSSPTDVSHPPVADVASPTPKQVEIGTKFPPSGENPRPKPSETNAPALPIAAALPSSERAGLSSIPPVLPSDVSSAETTETSVKPVVPASPVPSTDMPPNVVDKESKPSITFVPRVERAAPKLETAVRETRETSVAPPIGVAASRPATTRTHVVQKGDTYTSLAVKYLGSAKHAKLIEKANPGRGAAHLYVGAKINIPNTPAATPPTTKVGAGNLPTNAKKTGVSAKAKEKDIPPPDPSRAYVVQHGESWQSIARKCLGKGENDAELYELNKERVGGDPNLLRAGMVIELPARAKMPAKTSPTSPTPVPSTPSAASK